MEKIFHANSNQKRARMVILIAKKIDLKSNTVQETKKDTIQ